MRSDCKSDRASGRGKTDLLAKTYFLGKNAMWQIKKMGFRLLFWGIIDNFVGC